MRHMDVIGQGNDMPLLILILLIGVFAYLFWQRRTSSLTRICAWRLEKSAGQWRCAACGAVQMGEKEPRDCLRRD